MMMMMYSRKFYVNGTILFNGLFMLIANINRNKLILFYDIYNLTTTKLGLIQKLSRVSCVKFIFLVTMEWKGKVKLDYAGSIFDLRNR